MQMEEKLSAPRPAAMDAELPLPRVTIKFCTQCKWMLRAAYYAQELLSTFSTSLGEVALQPSTGGVFVVQIHHVPPTPATASSPPIPPPSPPPTAAQTRTLWDRKTDGGFPETKELKRRVRDVIDPGRNLGHVDRDYPPPPPPPPARPPVEAAHSSAHRVTAAATVERGGGPTTGAHHQEPVADATAIHHHHSAELGGTLPQPQPSAEASASTPTAAERLDLAHRAAVSPAADDAGPKPKCEDCQ